jgi:RAB protein geranylgeranyltransferase component A
MDTLDNTEWDVLIIGTGLQQSLLALYARTFHLDMADAI